MKVSLELDGQLYGPQGGLRHLWVRIEVPRTSAPRPRPPLDLALVLDRSGSMSGGKMELVRDAASRAAALLRDFDRCALVAYDHEIIHAVNLAPVSGAQRTRLLDGIARLEARGSTNLFGGWMAGAEEIAESEEGRVQRVLILTDGLANVGITEPGEILEHVRALATRGVGTSTFGVGRDFDEVLVSGMAEAGNGHFYYIEQAQQIPDYLTSELGELLTIAAKGATVALSVGGDIIASNLNGLPVLGSVWQLGDLSEGTVIDLCFALEIPADTARQVRVVVELRWEDVEQDAARSTAEEVTLRSASDAECAAEARSLEVVTQVVRTRAALSLTESLAANRAGDFGRARRIAEDAASLLLTLAGDSPVAREEVNKLRQRAVAFESPMDALSAKEMAWRSYMARRSRIDPLKDRKGKRT